MLTERYSVTPVLPPRCNGINFMPKRTLTDPYVKNLKVDERTEVFDKDTSGLALRVTPNGHKSFFYRYRFGGKIRRFTIGKYEPPTFTLATAREKARALRVLVSEGNDPQGDKQRKKNIEAPTTVGDLAKIFKEQYVSKNLKSSTQKSYNSRISKIENKFKDISIDEITRAEVKRFLRGIAETQPYNANRIQSIFSKMYSFAIREDYTSNHPLKKIEKFGKEKNREPNYSNDDIKSIWESFCSEDDPLSSLLKMLLICGQRLGETSRMKWSDIDTNRALWIIPEDETKGGKTHVVPLPEFAIKVLEELHSKTGDQVHVFNSSIKSGSPLTYFGAVSERVRKRTGLKDFKIHDLRHTVITGMISIGVDFVHVGKTVAHKGLGKEYVITNRYAHYEYLDEKKRALQLWSDHLERVLLGNVNAKVFKIGGS